MSPTLPLLTDRLMLLLDDPAQLASLLARLDLAPPPPLPAAAIDTADPLPPRATDPGPPAAPMPEHAVPDAEAPDVVLVATDMPRTVPDAAPPPAADAAPPVSPMPEDAFPTIAELDALMAESYAPQPGLDAAMRAELAEVLGLEPALVDDEDAFMAALAALEPPPEDVLPGPVSGEPFWVEAVREDWALG